MKKLTRTAIALAVMGSCAASLPAHALEQGDILVRFGPTWVMPNDDSGDVKPLDNTGVSVSDGTSLGITFTYMLRDQIGLELLGALPFEHEIEGTDDIDGLDIGTIEHLPPTLVMQYYFRPETNMRPYVGAGLNYTTFFNEEADSDLEAIVGDTDISLDDSTGLAVMAGVDYDISENWFFNASLWYLDIETTAKLETENAGDLKVDVDIDPWVVMLGVGTRF